MNDKCLYDTRFFVEYFYSTDTEFLKKLKEELRCTEEKLVSSLTVHEIHRINLKREGKEVASIRSDVVRRDFQVIDVNFEIAVKSAELRGLSQMPMAEGVIAATAQIHKCALVSDDAHFRTVKNLKTKWFSK